MLKNPFLPPGHYPMHYTQVFNEEEIAEIEEELRKDKALHPEKYLPSSEPPQTISPESPFEAERKSSS